jgi:hypothetical protein
LGEANLRNLLDFKLSQEGIFGGWNFSGGLISGQTSAPGELNLEGTLNY